jgi:hypothetical protein
MSLVEALRLVMRLFLDTCSVKYATKEQNQVKTNFCYLIITMSVFVQIYHYT